MSGGRPHHLTAPGDEAGGRDDQLVCLDDGPPAVVHYTLVYAGVLGLHLQHLQLLRARQQPN